MSRAGIFTDVFIMQVPGLMSRAGIFTDGGLVISTVIKEDTGWYKCRPSNGLGPPPEAQAYLNITCEYHVFLSSFHWLFHCSNEGIDT